MDASELKINGIYVSLLPYLKARIEVFHPAYFAMSMATGIISIVCYIFEMRGAAWFLFSLNILMYCGLWAVTILRAWFFSKKFSADWSSHHRGPGFLTTVAATCVLGTQFVVFLDNLLIGYALWCLGIILWCGCIYTIFVLLSIQENKPTLAEGINGGWLVAVVATQSVCVLGCKVLPARFVDSDLVYFFLLSLWFCGGMLYVWMISLIFYRYMFFRFDPEDLMPPYWINMGAVAISTLAGVMLITTGSNSALLTSILPFVKGVTLLYWATATWWIPMLVLLGFWRHNVRHLRFTYNPLYWGMVFPLGMYSICTYWVAKIFALPLLLWVAKSFVIIALIAWSLTFLAMVTRPLFLILLFTRTFSKTKLWRTPMTNSKISETRPEAMQRIGKGLILTGTILTIGGIVLYCIACFADEVNGDIGAILFEDSNPFALAALMVMGGGTISWLIGSFMHLKGLMDSDIEPRNVEVHTTQMKDVSNGRRYK